MTVKFTARTVDSLKAVPGRRVDYFDAAVPGLALRVTEYGHRSWSVHYRNAERRLRRLTLGDYPTVKLAAARKAAQRALRAASEGKDPAADKKAARHGETVGDLAKEYIERHAKKHKRSWREDDRMLEADVLPTWRTRKVKDLARRDVRELIEAIADRGSPIAANRCLALVRKMLNFAIGRDWIEANVASLLTKPGAERSRERVLDDDEIRQVWRACAGERPAMCGLMRLRLVTAQRGGELAHLVWKDVDLEAGWLTLSGSVTKNKLPHRVPLSTLAIEVLQAVPVVEPAEDDLDWVFPGRNGKKPFGDAKHAGRRVAARVLVELQKADPAIEAFDFRGHDLRRTAATRMGAAGIAQSDIARVLNHAEGGPRATHVYNRYQYDREKRIALDTWARTLTAILVEEKPAENIVPFSAEARR
jgi:integrase